MNSFEKLFSDAIDSFKKFFYSVYLLVCKPSVIVYSSFTPSRSAIIAPISFFIICEAVFYAFLRSVVNAYEQSNVLKASMESLQKIDFISFIIILIPTVIFIYIAIQVFSVLFIKDINQKQLFYNMGFYYAGIGLLISSSLIVLKYYLIPPRYESIGLSDEVNYLNGNYDNWRTIDYALMIADNITCVLIPAVFIYQLTRITRVFRWYYLLIILFSFEAFYIVDTASRFSTKLFKSDSPTEEITLFNCDDHLTNVSKIKIDCCIDSFQRYLTVSLCLYNRSDNKIQVKNDFRVTIYLLTQRNGRYDENNNIQRDIKLKLDSTAKTDFITLPPRSIFSYHGKSDEYWNVPYEYRYLEKEYNEAEKNNLKPTYRTSATFWVFGNSMSVNKVVLFPFVDNFN